MPEVALPNEASVALHEAMGFESLGVFRNVGYKEESWRDVGWWQRTLRDLPQAPEEPQEWRPPTSDLLGFLPQTVDLRA
jgi:phosphinothricin acetyltransferase